MKYLQKHGIGYRERDHLLKFFSLKNISQIIIEKIHD